jgi:hypothetical protein
MRLNAAEVEHWPDLVLGELRQLRFDVVAQDARGNSSWFVRFGPHHKTCINKKLQRQR